MFSDKKYIKKQAQRCQVYSNAIQLSNFSPYIKNGDFYRNCIDQVP